MNKIAAIALSLCSTLVVAAPTLMEHFLVAQWFSGGSTWCKYDNGTVLNYGIELCPMSIKTPL